jgi:dTDP-4-dehydrorhamnose reductase
MNVLVLGQTGQIARSLQARMPDATYFGRSQLDLEALDVVQAVVRDARPDFIVNAAAYTAVDAAEDDRQRAWRVNAQAVGEIAEAAARLGVPLMHISTDYVFSGETTRPYREDDPTGPVNEYGASKLQGEQEVAGRAGECWWVMRTSAVFSPFGSNFVKTMLRLANERRLLTVVNDQISRPSYAGDIAEAIVRVVDRYRQNQVVPSGIYHCASVGAASWFELAQAVLERSAEHGLIAETPELQPIATTDFPTRASRPRYSVLDTTRLEQALGWEAPHWRVGLESMLGSMRPSPDAIADSDCRA